MCIDAYARMCMYVSVSLCAYVHMHACICKCVCMCINMCVYGAHNGKDCRYDLRRERKGGKFNTSSFGNFQESKGLNKRTECGTLPPHLMSTLYIHVGKQASGDVSVNGGGVE